MEEISERSGETSDHREGLQPLQRMLVAGKVARKGSKSQNSPSSNPKKSPVKGVLETVSSPPFLSTRKSMDTQNEGGPQLCKRKVNFELSEITNDSKKVKLSCLEPDQVISVEPVD